jgi:biotin transport system permease protein
MKRREITLFRFIPGNSLVHRLPAWVKLCALLPISLGAFALSAPRLALLMAAIALYARFAGFSFKTQLRDLRPAVYYLVFLYWIDVASHLAALWPLAGLTPGILPAIFAPDPGSLVFLCRLVLIIQVSSLFFHTTTQLALKEALSAIETAGRRLLRQIIGPIVGNKEKIAPLLSLCLLFIPGILDAWNGLDLAWQGRGGKNGLRKTRVLFLALLGVCFHQAAQKARAIEARS